MSGFLAKRFAVVAMAAVMGSVLGLVVGYKLHPPGDTVDTTKIRHVLPHHVPQFAGGLSFRFAMAHDVIHERYAKHGPAHYRERNRLTREKLDALGEDDPARFPLEDDLAAGLERVGKTEEAVAVMRAKYARQREQDITGRELYTTYGNLGTFLIHASMREAMAGDEAARERFAEGVELVRKSVEVNPEAHFGRERWQARVAGFILQAMQRPELLKRFDCVGNSLASPDLMAMTWFRSGAVNHEFDGLRNAIDPPRFMVPGVRPDDPEQWQQLKPIREYITRVGGEECWEPGSDEGDVSPAREAVPFDEPMLGVIGMWRQGGGANPHFALAVGETMLRAGQRFIAWAAFERAHRLADRYWPDKQLQDFLREHCRARQAEIENSFTDGGPSPEELRKEFDVELQRGLDYQRAYQEYEAERIAGGASIFADDFFAEFEVAREPIASRVGPEEHYVWEVNSYQIRARARELVGYAIAGAGLFAVIGALLARVWIPPTSTPGSHTRLGSN